MTIDHMGKKAAPTPASASAGLGAAAGSAHARKRRPSRICKAIVLAAVAVLAIAAAFTTTGCNSRSTPTGNSTLKVGVRADVTGFGYYNGDTQKYYGLEIDIADALATRLGYADVQFETVTPDDRKQKLLDGNVDCIIACYSISDSREENFDFSPSYYDDYSALMVEKSSMITTIDQLKGLTVGTMKGTNAAPQLLAKLTEDGLTNGQPISANDDNSDVRFDTFHLLQFDSYAALSDALEGGTVDAACMDASISSSYIRDNRQLLDYKVATQHYGVATQKDSGLSSPVATTVQAMLDDGTIASLVDKWD